MDRRHFCAAALASCAPLAAAAPAAGRGRRSYAVADGTYAQAAEVRQPRRWLFVSGQVPADAQGEVPEGFEDQCRLAWRNVGAQLQAAGMGYAHLLKVTIYLARREDRDAARAVRQELLGRLPHPPALTVVVAGIYDSAWRLEIEAIAAD
ncbi:RidA family protein [Lysobacter sp. 5GHs7-4]|uniref:RidA family protein n=1 Tax=Lysobacter sp. 5GHs7-4 TaxID=2904253 RepID=UPI001E4F2100|nr:RidA family protein [Lysobacter sp. 5GHs7-4]UHQ23715.1 RidA family protein [Lysobacter sp. 5GHs7-4]